MEIKTNMLALYIVILALQRSLAFSFSHLSSQQTKKMNK